ncbi:MAG: hydrogenase iron-sulfur subunit, partial [Desulfovibrio sp.]
MAEKIGIYFDESSVGPYFDYEALVESVENKWGEVAPVVKTVQNLASEEGKALIQADIDAEGLEAVVIGGATPRVHWEYFDFGSDIFVERVNLREQCVMSYQAEDGTVAEPIDPEEDYPIEQLVEIVLDYMSMGVARAKNATVPEAQSVEAVKTVLVIGGGWAGLSAALDVAAAGYDAVILEKTGELGGKAAAMFKTIPLAPPYEEATDTGIENKIAAVEADDKITVKLSTTLKTLTGAPGVYSAALSNGETLDVGSVILAAGWEPQETSVLAPLGYGTLEGVVTTAEFEKMAKDGQLNGQKVAFVLDTTACEPEDLYAAPEPVEEEEEKKDEEEEDTYVHEDLESERHLPYAKSVNTMVALKQANYVDGVSYIFYDHMIVPGIQERYYKTAQDAPGVMLTKGNVTSVAKSEGGLLVTAENTLFGAPIEVEVDMVVLPTGMVPATAKDPILNFEYRQGPNFPDLELFDGFADSNYICFPYETRRTGVYAAGSVRQPMLMDAAEEDASGAALKAIQCIESSNRGVAVHPRSGDLSFPDFNFVRCTQCKRCTEECPFGALDDDEKGTPMPNPTRCRRCGTCMGACPERVITFATYGIGMLSEVIRQYNVPDSIEEGGPRILILACENDAYPALDMAAKRGHKWSPYVRIMPVRCLGSVNTIWIKDALAQGLDGVILIGCKHGDDYQCHFVKG